MKHVYFFIIAMFFTITSVAQVPDKMSYQAVVRNASNQLVISSSIGIRISILKGSVSGVEVYTETQMPTSNTNGLISLEIGDGSVVSGDFSGIDWSNGPYFVKTEIDPNGGSNYTISGITQLLSVPYALYAKTAESVTNDQVDDADADATNEIQTLSQSDNTITLSKGGGSVTIANTQLTEAQVDEFVANNGYLKIEADGSITNEIQSLSQNGNTITLSKNGGSVTITDTDTQLSEAQVDQYVANNGYLTSEVDGSVTNEIQTLSQNGNTITLSNGGGSVTVTDTDTQLSEAQVDTYVSNNGYPTGVENLKIIQGTISPSGVILGGSGFTVVKNGTGDFKITFNSSFAGYPAVTYSTNYYPNIIVSNVLSVNSVSLLVKNTSGTVVDPNVWFSFIAIGKR